MGGYTIARRKFHYLSAAASALALVAPLTALAAPAARVEFAMGDPVAVSPSGQSRSLVKGVQVESGETVYTKSGRMQLRFTDGAYVSLQPNSEFRIDEYRYDGKTDGSERGFFSLLKGGMRTITGLVGRTNKKNYQVSTTVATIGIRGTEYTIAYTNSITGSVGEGEVEVCSGLGCVPFGSGQSFIVTDPNSRPQLTSQKTDLPPQQPGDPEGGAFQTANDPSKPNGQGSGPTFVSTPVIDDSLPPLIGKHTLTAGWAFDSSVGMLEDNVVELDATGAVTTMTVDVCGDDCIESVMFDGIEKRPDGKPDMGNIGSVFWGRAFKNTSSQSLSFSITEVPVSLDSKEYFHYVGGPPTLTSEIETLALSRPVGVYTVTGAGATIPTGFASRAGGTIDGTFNSSTLSVSFRDFKADWTASVTVDGVLMNMAAAGMDLTRGGAGTTFRDSGNCSVNTGAGSCSVAGGLFKGATAAGVVYAGSLATGNGSVSAHGGHSVQVVPAMMVREPAAEIEEYHDDSRQARFLA